MFVSISDSILNFCVKAVIAEVIAYILCLDVCRYLEFYRWFIFFKAPVILSKGMWGFYEGTFVRSLVHWTCKLLLTVDFFSQCPGWLWIAKRSRWEGEALEGRYTWHQIYLNSRWELLPWPTCFWEIQQTSTRLTDFHIKPILVGTVQSTLPETNSKRTWKWMVGRRSFPFPFWVSAYFHGFSLVCWREWLREWNRFNPKLAQSGIPSSFREGFIHGFL